MGWQRMELSARIARIEPSATMAVSMQAAALRAAGRDIIALSAGDPDFPTPANAVAAAIEAIHAGQTKYTQVDGTPELKRVIADKLERDHGLGYSMAEILVSSGAKHSIFNCLLALLGPGDEAIVPAPHWVSFPDMVRLAEATPVVVPCVIESDYKLSPAALEAAIGPRTRALILNSPCNPTGIAYRPDELAALGEVLRRHPRIVVISDDVYERIYWGEPPLENLVQVCPDLRERVVLVNGVSKTYAMSGWRIGYAAAAPHLIEAMRRIQSQSTSNPCSVSQAAAAAAIAGPQDDVARMAEAYRRRHDRIAAVIDGWSGVRFRRAEGAFYLLLDFSSVLAARGLADDAALAADLLEQAGVALVPGSAFGAPGCLRLSFAASTETLDRALARLSDYLNG